MSEEFTPLALSTAYATSATGETWYIYDGGKTELAQFSKKWSPSDCRDAIEFGQKYELIAFNRGIEFGKDEYKAQTEPVMEAMKKDLIALEQMNIKLSNKLEKFIIEGA